METTCADSLSDMALPCDMVLWVMTWRSAWPIFHGPVILLISWLFDVCTSYFGIMNQYDQTFDLKINVGHYDLYFMVLWFCPVSWRLFDIWTSLFGIMNQYDPTFDLRLNVGHCDIYFMVQWFCLISWRLVDVCTSYFGIMGQYHEYDQTFDLIINVCHYDIIIFHGPVILPYVWKTIWWMSVIFSDSETGWPKLWPQNKYRPTRLIFHGLVILRNVFKIIDVWTS